MNSDIIISIVTVLGNIAGVVVASIASSNKIHKQLEISQAVTDTKIENLTNEVRTCNEITRRMPVLEARVDALNQRVENLERDHRD